MQFGSGKDKNILGLVGSSGALNRLMILSKPDLHRSFARPENGHNVGVHEFAHLIDGADGSVDGIPAATCPDCVKPWTDLMRREMARLAVGDSVLSRYGLKNPAEFFAVVSEVFFSNPHRLSENHPELYRLLVRVFHQDARSIIRETAKAMFRPYGRRLERNAKCPCGRNEGFKDCCLKNWNTKRRSHP
jgi:Mlc titration factor MtfA (ptsG expression regulator)